MAGYGRGRGVGFNYYQPAEMYDSHLGRSVKNYIKPDPRTGNFKIHVACIPNDWSKAVLENVFSRVGVPLNTYIAQPLQANSQKWGFVEFATFQEARKAVQDLNNYLDLDIVITFAKEKQDDESNAITSSQRKDSPFNRRLERENTSTPPEMIKRFIKNDTLLKYDLPSATHSVVETSAAEEDKIIGRQLFKRIVKLDKEDLPPYGECRSCHNASFLACECKAEYCSIDCQTKDWPNHFKNCRPCLDGNESGSVKSDQGGGGDNNQRRSYHNQTNGYGSNERYNQPDNKGRDNNLNGRFNDRSSSNHFNRSNNRFGDRQYDKDNRGGSRPETNRSEDHRSSMVEQRRSKIFSVKNHEQGGSSNRQFSNNQSERRGDSGYRNNRQSFNTHETTRHENDDWDSANQGQKNIGKDSEGTLNLLGNEFFKCETEFINKPEIPATVTSPNSSRQNETDLHHTVRIPAVQQAVNKPSQLTLGETVTKPEIPATVTSPNSSRQNETDLHRTVRIPAVQQAVNKPSQLTLGETVTICITHVVGDGIYFAQLKSLSTEYYGTIQKTINADKDNQAIFTPVENGICIAEYESTWYRSKITKMTPLTVWFMDFGNTDTIRPDQLRCMQPALEAIPPFVVKIKLAEGTPDEYFKKIEGGEMIVKPVDQSGDLWVVQIDGVTYPTPASSSPPVTTQKTTVASNHLLPADKFTEVQVKIREDSFFSVMPTEKREDLRSLTESIQTLAPSAPPISPKPKDRCVIKLPKDNKWYRGQVIRDIPGQESTVEIKLVDEGGFEVIQYSPSNLKALPSQLATVAPFVTYIKPDSKEKSHLFSQDIIAVKPFYKDTDQIWVVDVKPVVKHETATSASVVASPSSLAVSSPAYKSTYPMFMPPDQFTTVLVSFVDVKESETGDVYFVGPRTLLSTLEDMCIFFSRIFGICQKIHNAVPGVIGISYYDDVWYRSKVLRVEPMEVLLIDYGLVVKINRENIRECPKEYKDTKPLVQRIQLVPETEKKYFNLPAESELSVKPIKMLSNDTFLVQVEGEKYNGVTKQDVTVSSSQSTSVSSQRTVTTEPTLSVAKQEPQSPTSAESQFPEIFDRSGYTSVTVTQSVLCDGGPTDTYFVGLSSVWLTEMTRISHELSSIVDHCPVIQPKLGDVCMSFYDSLWYRVRVISLSPLKVFFMDYGNTEVGNELRQCPEHLQSLKQLVYKIKLAPGTSEKYFGLSEADGSCLSVKPVAKLLNNTTVVQVEGEMYTGVTEQDITVSSPQPTSVTLQRTVTQEPTLPVKQEPQSPLPQSTVKNLSHSSPPPAEPQFPEMFDRSGYTSVVVTYPVLIDSGPTDTYYVGLHSNWTREMTEMIKNLSFIADQCPVVITPKLGDVFLSFFDNAWYRVRVISLSPLKVFYMDYGNTEVGNMLRQCPEHLKSLKQLVHKIKLASGTSEKYFGLSEEDSHRLLVKPVEKLPNNTIVVQVEGEMYNVVAKQDLSVSSSLPASVTQEPTLPVRQEPHSTVDNLSHSPQPSPAEPEFPEMFDHSGYTSVVVTYPVLIDSGPTDTYYVGLHSNWTREMTEMIKNLNLIADQCPVIPPKLGDVFMSFFDNAWYRVRVISPCPLKVFYMDYGNLEVGNELRQCPEHLKSLNQLVHKIKLAPGTNKKYFGLSESNAPFLRVKPVAKLPGETIVVQVEGESYSEAPIEHQSISVMLPNTAVKQSVPKEVSSLPAVPNNVVDQPSPQLVTRGKNDHVINLVSNNWKVTFLSQLMDPTTHELFGTLYTSYVPETETFFKNDWEKSMDVQKFDSEFKPQEGELVGCKYNEVWVRAIATENGDVHSLVDSAVFLRGSRTVKRLPEQFVQVPHMGVVFKVPGADQKMLHDLHDEMLIVLTVETCTEVDGERIVQVRRELLSGRLRRWECYTSPKIPYPLADGDSVMFSHLLDSNTAVVCSPDRDQVELVIQRLCYKAHGEALKTAPKVGDFVALKCSKDLIYYRVEVEEVNTETGECTVLKVDKGARDKCTLSNLYPLPSSLLNKFCRLVPVKLKDVDKIKKSDMNAESTMYIQSIDSTKKPLKIKLHKDLGTATLFSFDSENINEKLQGLLKPKIAGMLTLASLPPYKPTMGEEIPVVVSNKDPLYIQDLEVYLQYLRDLYQDIQIAGQASDALYNPCVGELCLVKYEFDESSDWYRSVCTKETNLGLSQQFLVDYGSIVNVLTNDIRPMRPEFLTIPAIGLRAEVIGLSEEDKVRVADQLKINSQHKVIVETVDTMDEMDTYHVRVLS